MGRKERIWKREQAQASNQRHVRRAKWEKEGKNNSEIHGRHVDRSCIESPLHHTMSIRACISIAEKEWPRFWISTQNGHSKSSAEACGLHSQTPTVNEIFSWPTLLDSLEIPQIYETTLSVWEVFEVLYFEQALIIKPIAFLIVLRISR